MKWSWVCKWPVRWRSIVVGLQPSRLFIVTNASWNTSNGPQRYMERRKYTEEVHYLRARKRATVFYWLKSKQGSVSVLTLPAVTWTNGLTKSPLVYTVSLSKYVIIAHHTGLTWNDYLNIKIDFGIIYLLYESFYSCLKSQSNWKKCSCVLNMY